MPPAPALPDWDAEEANGLAAAVLFATPPTDRALKGWDGADEAYAELVLLCVIDPMSSRVA